MERTRCDKSKITLPSCQGADYWFLADGLPLSSLEYDAPTYNRRAFWKSLSYNLNLKSWWVLPAQQVYIYLAWKMKSDIQVTAFNFFYDSCIGCPSSDIGWRKIALLSFIHSMIEGIFVGETLFIRRAKSCR